MPPGYATIPQRFVVRNGLNTRLRRGSVLTYMTAGKACVKPLNPSRLQRQPLSGAHGLCYAQAGGSTAAIFKENLADVPPRRRMAPC